MWTVSEQVPICWSWAADNNQTRLSDNRITVIRENWNLSTLNRHLDPTVTIQNAYTKPFLVTLTNHHVCMHLEFGLSYNLKRIIPNSSFKLAIFNAHTTEYFATFNVAVPVAFICKSHHLQVSKKQLSERKNIGKTTHFIQL